MCQIKFEVLQLTLFAQDKTADENFSILQDLLGNLQQRVAPVQAPQVAPQAPDIEQEQVSNPAPAVTDAMPAAAQQNLPSKEVIDDFVAKSKAMRAEYVELFSLYLQTGTTRRDLAEKVGRTLAPIPSFLSDFKEVMQGVQKGADPLGSIKYVTTAVALNKSVKLQI